MTLPSPWSRDKGPTRWFFVIIVGLALVGVLWALYP